MRFTLIQVGRQTRQCPYTPEVSQAVVRAVIGMAAFAGLREGEIRGQWWEDDEGDVLNIRRSVWRTHLNYETKTHEDEDDPGVVPIIEPLRGILDAIKPEIATGWMFPNTIGGALDLDNLAARVIKPVLKANGLKWKGWHAYRRGLATNLHELGVPDKVIQAILRREDVKTTQRELYQDRAKSSDERHEATGSKNSSCSSCAASRSELTSSLERMEPTSGLEPLTCRLRIGCSTN